MVDRARQAQRGTWELPAANLRHYVWLQWSVGTKSCAQIIFRSTLTFPSKKAELTTAKATDPIVIH